MAAVPVHNVKQLVLEEKTPQKTRQVLIISEKRKKEEHGVKIVCVT